MLNKWAIFIALIMHGCGASAPIQPKSLTQDSSDTPSTGVAALSSFEGTRTSKFSGVTELEFECSMWFRPTPTKKFWVFTQVGEGPNCQASQVVLDPHGTVIRFNYPIITNTLSQTGDWATAESMLALVKLNEVRTMRLAVPSPIVRGARLGESVAEVDGQSTSIRKEVTKDGLVLRTETRSSEFYPFTLLEKQYGFIPTGEIWVRDGTYEASAAEVEEGHVRQEVFQKYRDTTAITNICEDGAPVECSVQAAAALSLRETKMARHLVETGCSQNDAESCARLGVYKRQGIGAKADEAAALVDLKNGCELGAGAACFGASLSPDLAKAEQPVFLEKGCALGSSQACAVTGRNSASDGEVAEGLTAMQTACDKDFLSCDILFEAQIEFLTGPARVQGAENLAKLCPTKWQACEKALRFPDLLDEESLEEIADVERDVSAQACRQGEAAACYRQGTLFLDGLGGEVETAEGLDFRRKACEMADYLCEKSSDK